MKHADKARNARPLETRRAFLVGAAGTLAACAAPLPAGIPAAQRSAPSVRSVSPRSARIAIVGAGAAGLTCAYRLHQSGIA